MKPQGINSRFSGKQRFEQSDFSGGMNTKDDPIQLKENQCQRLLNLIPAIGSPIQRNGIIASEQGDANYNVLSSVRIYDEKIFTFSLSGNVLIWYYGDTSSVFKTETNDVFLDYDHDSITSSSINENTFILFPGHGTWLIKPNSLGNPESYFLNHQGYEALPDVTFPGGSGALTVKSPHYWAVKHKDWIFKEQPIPGSPNSPASNPDLKYMYDHRFRASASNSQLIDNVDLEASMMNENYLFLGYAIQLVNLGEGTNSETSVSSTFRSPVVEFPVRLDKDIRVLPFLKHPFSYIAGSYNEQFEDLSFVNPSYWVYAESPSGIVNTGAGKVYASLKGNVAARNLNSLDQPHYSLGSSDKYFGLLGLKSYVLGRDNEIQNTPNVTITLSQTDPFFNNDYEYETSSTAPLIRRKSGKCYNGKNFMGGPNFPLNPYYDCFKGATHIRIYRTLFQETVAGAQGGSAFRFLVDIPINDACLEFASGEYNDTTSEDELMGSDHVLDIGFQQPPKGSVVKYSSGRLWIGGSDSGRSKIFYSKLPSNSAGYISDASKFYLEENWLDIGLDSKQEILAIEDCKDALVLFGTNKAYELSQGNPFTGLRVLAENGGIMGKRAYCKFESGIYYISRSGPAIIDGGKFNLLNDFSIGELFPESGIPHQRESYLANNFQGNIPPSNEFYISQRTDACARSLFSKEYIKLQTWIQNDIIYTKYQYKNTLDAWEDVMFGFRINHGAFEIAIDPNYTPQAVIQITGSKTIGINKNGTFFDLFVLTTTSDKDAGGVNHDFPIEFRSKRFLTNKEDQCRFGELYDAKINCRYLDVDHPKFTIIADDSWMIEDIDKLETNYVGVGSVNNRHTSDAIDFSNNHANYLTDVNKMRNSVMHIRNNVQLGFREGIYGQYFELWMSKISSNIFKFYGFDINYHIRDSAIPIFITHDTQQLDGISVQSNTTAAAGGIGYSTISASFRIGS